MIYKINLFSKLNFDEGLIMTTIVYKNGVLASDSKISDPDSMSSNYMKKIFKLSVAIPNPEYDGASLLKTKEYLIGIVGDMYAGLLFIKWFQTGDDSTKDFLRNLGEDYFFEAIVVTKDQNLCIYNNFLEPLELGKLNFYALGSGSKIAMAMLDYGASIEDTLTYAKKYDMNTGGDTHILSFT
jgi:hypothetical protein